jgi:hypothetical protein
MKPSIEPVRLRPIVTILLILAIGITAVAGILYVWSACPNRRPAIAGTGTSSDLNVWNGPIPASRSKTPTVINCGDEASVIGTDFDGILYVGKATTVCMLEFAGTWASPPVCAIDVKIDASTWRDAIVLAFSPDTTTVLFGNLIAREVIHYTCAPGRYQSNLSTDSTNE